jgi:CRP/FNR family nitrogen fixation transcriptional regulator
MIENAIAKSPQGDLRQKMKGLTRPLQFFNWTKNQLLDSPDLTGTLKGFTRRAEVYHQGQPTEYVYKVVSGVIRTYRVCADGRLQIGSFHRADDVFGLDERKYFYNADVTTSRASVLAFKRSLVTSAMTEDIVFAAKLLEHTARELQRTRNHLLLLRSGAEERVAFFIWDAARYQDLTDAIDLPSQSDVANYLGLRDETVCRILARFEVRSIISRPSKGRVIVTNLAALQNKMRSASLDVQSGA